MAATAAPLLVISVDGLDYRYLRDADKLGLKIPNLRAFMSGGECAAGVVGVWPTVTWPSHTSLITGVRPDQHGILGNRRPRAEGGDYYWSVDLLKAPTLWQAVRAAGGKTAAVTWPVTVDAPIDYNLPERFLRRNGGEMDLEGIAQKATPGLVGSVAAAFPSFPREWVDDRARALATVHLLRTPRPDLILLHLVDLDSAEHDKGPFTREANATLEYTDELIGQILAAAPPAYIVAIVSDHGFECNDAVVNLKALAGPGVLADSISPLGGIVTASTPEAAAFLRRAAQDPKHGIGREVPREELARYAPALASAVAAFEPAEHFWFGAASTDIFEKPHELGLHGFWPARRDYRSVFILRGPGIRPNHLGEISMLDIATRLARAMRIPFAPAPGH